MDEFTPKQLEEEISKTQAAFSNMTGFSAWDFSAYKVQAHEKDVIINALGYYLAALRAKEEETNDDTELCE